MPQKNTVRSALGITFPNTRAKNARKKAAVGARSSGLRNPSRRAEIVYAAKRYIIIIHAAI